MEVESVKTIENKIKQLAQDLGTMNLSLNSIQQQNDKTRKEIQQLNTRIKKKKVVIQQQNKDKMIIHAKLISAQRKKQQYEIKMSANLKQQQPIKHIPKKSIIQQNQSKKPIVPIQEYKNTEKGSYEPPSLFTEENNQKQQQKSDDDDQQGDVNDEQLLETIRKNFQNDKGDNDDD